MLALTRPAFSATQNILEKKLNEFLLLRNEKRSIAHLKGIINTKGAVTLRYFSSKGCRND